MRYESLDTLPVKLFYKISETNDFSLLSDKKEDDLEQVWEQLKKDYQSYNPKARRIAGTFAKLQKLNATYSLILMIIEVLDFTYNQELVDMLKNYGYSIDSDNYYEDLARIGKENESLLVQIQHIESTLPSGKIDITSLDKVMAGYARILGFDFDYNTVSVTKFFALQEQVNIKIKSNGKANNKTRPNNRRG